MVFERIEDRGLSQYSYIVGCATAGQVAVIDPRRDVDVYVDYAAAQNVAISHVFETHIHADFASGARELADRTGARLLLSAYDEGEIFETKFPHQPIKDGDFWDLGIARIKALHTPGHTPEHMAYLVYDLNRSADVPMALLSGDFVFVGSLGRPDLLGEEAKRGLAEKLYESATSKLAPLPDGLEIHPGHGAGSMCGAGMSARPFTTLGYERMANPYLQPLSREDFVARILGSVPPFPDYYRRMKKLNSEGPRILGELPGQRPIEPARFRRLVDDEGHIVIDLRDQLAFGSGHIPGAFGIGAGTGLSTWASWVVPYERPLLLVGESAEAVRSLVRVGLDQVRGFLDGGMPAWRNEGYPLATTRQIEPGTLFHRLKENAEDLVIDVRSDSEWVSGHVDGARHIMGGFLPGRIEEIRSAGRPVVLVCGSGYRSTVAASVLERAGLGNVTNMAGGMTAWSRKGLPVSTAA